MKMNKNNINSNDNICPIAQMRAIEREGGKVHYVTNEGYFTEMNDGEKTFCQTVRTAEEVRKLLDKNNTHG